MTLPPCPRCGAVALKQWRADTDGQVWAWCEACTATVLLGADGRILHVSATE